MLETRIPLKEQLISDFGLEAQFPVEQSFREEGLYYFNARFYDATTGRFINVDPIQDGTNHYIYVSNNPMSMVDPTGLDDLYANFNKTTGSFTGTYVPINSNGGIDYNGIKTFKFNASNNVRNEINGQRPDPNVKTMPSNGDAGEYYFPRDFPTGKHEAGLSRQISDDHPAKDYLGDVFVPTTATQEVPTYGIDVPKLNEVGKYESTNTQEDSGYGVHYSPGNTLGCIATDTQESANTYANYSDKAINSGGTSDLNVEE